ncbi:alkyl sulfatase dimerization domain-containing protein [Halocatena halophila]|uniref:alkyl sulfatase dimerization domain-containing protein n=1 Tax=Halocatena halophila TaxID=2814576 RepID=UPI002ED22AE1
MSHASMDAFALDAFIESIDCTTVADGVHHCTAFSGVTAFETEAGLVLVDTGLRAVAGEIARMLREKTDAPIHTAIYTHGHMDHAFGLEAYLKDDQEPPTVIGHEAIEDRFDRYELTAGHNDSINSRQFGGTAEDDGQQPGFGWPAQPPTTTYEDALTVEVGELTFELQHGRGETDDHTWLYCPERDVVCSGDFVITVAPNAGNPQKVQRYPTEWAEELRKILAVEPGTLCPGHGEPIVDDPDAIATQLRTGAEYLDTIVDRTIELLNDGAPPHVDIVTEIELPEPDEPWLQEVYDTGEFIVRNVIRRYGGWWSGRPSELKPAPRGDLAAEIVRLAGGVDRVLDRVETLTAEDELRRACHLADFALEATPNNEQVRTVVVDVYERRAERADDLMSKNIYASAGAYASEGRRFR